METRKNINKLSEKNLSNINRCITFDGPLHMTSRKNLGHIVQRLVRDSSNELANHIEQVSLCNRRVKLMEVHWKLDIKNNLYFTYCTMMKLETFRKPVPLEIPD